MPVVIPTGFALVSHELQLTGDPDPMFVTYGLDKGVPVIDTAMCNTLKASFETRFNARLPTVYTSVSVRMRDEVNFAQSNTASVAFANAGTPMPQNNAWLARKVTGLVGRRNRGRMYFPGVIEADVGANGDLGATPITNWTTALNNFNGDLGTSFGGMVILHSDGGSPTPTPVTVLVIDNVIATQRRRLR